MDRGSKKACRPGGSPREQDAPDWRPEKMEDAKEDTLKKAHCIVKGGRISQDLHQVGEKGNEENLSKCCNTQNQVCSS